MNMCLAAVAAGMETGAGCWPRYCYSCCCFLCPIPFVRGLRLVWSLWCPSLLCGFSTAIEEEEIQKEVFSQVFRKMLNKFDGFKIEKDFLFFTAKYLQ